MLPSPWKMPRRRLNVGAERDVAWWKTYIGTRSLAMVDMTAIQRCHRESAGPTCRYSSASHTRKCSSRYQKVHAGRDSTQEITQA